MRVLFDVAAHADREQRPALLIVDVVRSFTGSKPRDVLEAILVGVPFLLVAVDIAALEAQGIVPDVIVGTSAGSVLAARLSEDSGTSVLLLEAGPEDRNPWIHIPIGVAKTIRDPSVNWLYSTEPDAASGSIIGIVVPGTFCIGIARNSSSDGISVPG